MTKGTISKIVNSFGSTWGRIVTDGDARDVFFNAASFDVPAEYTSIDLGQAVEFDEHADQVNGSVAEHLVLGAALVVAGPGSQ